MADSPPMATSLKLPEHLFRLQEPELRQRPAEARWKVVNSLEQVRKSVLVKSHQHHHPHGAATLKCSLELSHSASTSRIPSDNYYRSFI